MKDKRKIALIAAAAVLIIAAVAAVLLLTQKNNSELRIQNSELFRLRQQGIPRLRSE